MITRDELLACPEYWTTQIQLDLFNHIENYMKEQGLSRTELAKKLGVTKGYISQVLSGDFNHRISKLVELSLAIGCVPQITYVSLDKIFSQETELKTRLLMQKSFICDYTISYENQWCKVNKEKATFNDQCNYTFKSDQFNKVA